MCLPWANIQVRPHNFEKMPWETYLAAHSGAETKTVMPHCRPILAKLAAAWANSPAERPSILSRSLYSSSTRSGRGSDSRLLPTAMGMYSFKLSG